tara:strand:- start:3761 stop:4180 length:420 start_codon:yes stop_codon:yes gene_type:complete
MTKFFTLITLLFFINTENIQKENQTLILLERTACFGNCPVYSIKIKNNGSGIYVGKNFVKNIGEFTFNISKSEIDKILKKAEKIDFWNLKNEYYENISDLPTTYIQIKNKKIKDYVGAPKQLKELQKLIDNITIKSISD